VSKPRRVRNLDRLERKLGKLSRLASADVLENALHAGAQEIRNAAIDKAPYRVGGGGLRGSILTKTDEKSGSRVSVLVGTNLVYAAIQEFGGTIFPKKGRFLVFEIDGKKIFARKVTLPPRPYLRPAFDEQKGEAVKVFRLAVADQIKAIARG